MINLKSRSTIKNKDLTFSPRFYTSDKILLQNEYRQVNLDSSHISDFSFFFCFFLIQLSDL